MMANSNEDVTEAIKILTEHIEHHWRQLGKGLGLSKTDLDGIEHDNQYLPGRIHDLFYLWQRRNGCNATVEQLKKALVDSNLGHMLSYLDALETDNASGPQTKIHVKSLLKDPLEDKEKEVHVSDDVPPTKKLKLSKCTTAEQEFEVSDFSGYRDFLMDIYASQLPMGSKWPEMGSNEYINLTIYEKYKLEDAEDNNITNVTGELEKFTQLKKVEIMQVGVDETGIPYSVCIITGVPGVGKSCFVWSLATKWKDRELFKEYELAIVIRLRDPYVRHAKNVVDLIQYEISDKVSHWMNMNNGRGCLLILDGYDEFPAEFRRQSLIKKIICGEILGKASLIITTRSNAAKDLYSICNRRKCQYLEVLGFDKHQINDYVLSAFKTSSLQKDFLKYLQCYPNIRSFMCIPLHCAIVLQIYKSQRSKKKAPKTMTELYTDAVKVLIIRSLQSDNPSLVEEGLDDFTDLLPEDHKCLKELSRIAYETTLADELVFYNKISKQMKRLDLLEAQPELHNPVSTLVSYNFVHKTIQEFLAAYHISLLPSNEQLPFLRKQFHISRMAMVIRFVAGLTKFNQLTDTDDLKHLFSTEDTQMLMQCVHCLFETQNSDFIKTVIKSKNIFDLTLYTLSPHDCYALNYCISISHADLDIRLSSCNISDEALSMQLQPIEHNANMFCFVKDLVLTKNHVKSRFSDICAALMKNSCVTSLYMEECGIDSNAVEDIKKLLLTNTTLKRLVLNANSICDEGAMCLGAGLKENHSIKFLSVRNCRISPIGIEAISEALIHNKTLDELNLSDNSIGNHGVSVICKALKGPFALKKLVLHRCDIYPEEECIENLRALCEKEGFTLYIDGPIQKILQRLFASHVSQKTTCTSEPYVRNGGCGVICEGKLFVWGGHTDIKSKIGGMTYLPCTESNAFDVWDTMTQIWSHQPTCGDVPELGLGSSLTSYSRCLYLYGGWINYGKDVFSGDIYRISLDAFKWEMIPVPPASTTTIKPSPRYATGVILFDDKLCMFGGVGPNIVEHQDPGAEWVKAVNQDSGWNNEYYEFDLKNDSWSAPLGNDVYRPKPIGSFSFCKITCNSAILFGGTGSEDKAGSHSNRIYHFNLKDRVWTRPTVPSQPQPTGCRFHTLSPLFDPESVATESNSPHWMVLLWGKVSVDKIHQDAWVLNVANWTWKKLQLHASLKPRAWHIACSRYAQRDIVVFGGNMRIDDVYCHGRCAVADLQLISFDQILQGFQGRSA